MSLLSDSDKKADYDGNKQEPAVTVTSGSGRNAVMVPASEYNVIYSNNIYRGKAMITVVGKDGGKYGDSTVCAKNTVTFIIK